jgi:GNAT superfamily N-acetyltransferase
MTVEIVRFRPSFKDAVVTLQTRHWSPDPAVNVAYLEWKYERNPYLPGGMIHLALSDGRVVGMRGLYGARWEAGRPNEVFAAPCAADTLILPEHRGGGLLARLMRAADDDLAAIGTRHAVNLSANLAMQLVSLGLGWRSVGPLEVDGWRPPGDTDWTPYPDGQDPFAALDERAARGPVVRVTLARAPRPEEMADVVRRVGRDGRIRHVRDAEYFAWRFGNPLARYRFLFWGDAELQGYLVLHARATGGGSPLTIADWEAATEMARSELLRAAIRWASPARLRIWASSLSVETRALLGSAGFFVLDAPESLGHALRAGGGRRTILVRAVTPDAGREWCIAGRRLLDLRDWDVRALDADSF